FREVAGVLRSNQGFGEKRRFTWDPIKSLAWDGLECNRIAPRRDAGPKFDAEIICQLFLRACLGRYREEIGFMPIAEAQKLTAIVRDVRYIVAEVAGREWRR